METYISEEEKVSVKKAGDSTKYGKCEKTGRTGEIYHYQGFTKTRTGGWNEVFAMFVCLDAMLDHWAEYGRGKILQITERPNLNPNAAVNRPIGLKRRG